MYRLRFIVCALLLAGLGGTAVSQPNPSDPPSKSPPNGAAHGPTHDALIPSGVLTAVPTDSLPSSGTDDTSIARLLDIPARPPRLLSDTMEYCQDLLANLAKLRSEQLKLPPEADMLASEGQHMCEQGNYRAGINRLRNALIVVQREQNINMAKP